MAPHDRQRRTATLRERTDDRNTPDDKEEDDGDNDLVSTQSSQGDWYEIESIIGEKATRYRVRWKGLNPQTGLPWKPEWVKKDLVTGEAKREWEDKKKAQKDRRKKKRKRQRETNSHVIEDEEEKEGLTDKRRKHPRITVVDEDPLEATQNSDYIPTQSDVLTQQQQPSSSPPSSPLPHILRKERTSNPFFAAVVINADNTPVSPSASSASHQQHQQQPQPALLGVAIAKLGDFDAKKYDKISDTILVPATQIDSSLPNRGPAALDLQDDPIESTERNAVIPDSQGLDDTTDISTFIHHPSSAPAKQNQELLGGGAILQEKSFAESSNVGLAFRGINGFLKPGPVQPQAAEESPPPSYLESISTQSTTNSAIPKPAKVCAQLVETAVQTSPQPEEETQAEPEPEPSRKPIEAAPLPDEQTQQEEEQETETFDLDIPQQLDLSCQIEDLPDRQPPKENTPPVATEEPQNEPEKENPDQETADTESLATGEEDSVEKESVEEIDLDEEPPEEIFEETSAENDTGQEEVPEVQIWEDPIQESASHIPNEESVQDKEEPVEKEPVEEINLDEEPPEEILEETLAENDTGQEKFPEAQIWEDPKQDEPTPQVPNEESVQDNDYVTELAVRGVFRRQHFRGIKLEDWFRIDQNAERSVSEPPSSQNSVQQHSDFPLPPNTVSEYTNLDFPLPPQLSRTMSEAPSQSLPVRPTTLREKMEANRRKMEEELALRRTISSRQSSIARSSPIPTREFLSPFPPSPTVSVDTKAESGAQSPVPWIPRHTQEFSATASTESSTPAAQPETHARGNVPESPLQSTQMQSQLLFGPPSFGPAEYAIALPLSTETVQADGLSQKSVYLNEIVKKHVAIEAYLANYENADEEVAFNLIRTIGQISTHPNLAYPVPTSNTADEKEAEFQIVMSAKFRFLRDLFVLVKEENVKIAVVAEAPQLIDMLEVFFRGIKIAHKRLDKLSTLPSASGSGAVGSECHIVIAMDSTFEPDSPEVVQIRRNTYHPSKIAPVLRLVTINTIEHALLCVSGEADRRLYACVEAVKILRNDSGVLDPQYAASIGDAPKKIADWISKRCEGKLVGIPALPELPLFDATQSDRASYVENGDKRKRQNSLPGAPPSDLKKRRVAKEPVPPSTADATHISNTMPSQPLQKPVDSSHPRVHPTVNKPDNMDVDDNETESDTDPELGAHAQPLQPIIPEEPLLEEMSRDELLKMFKHNNETLKTWMESANRLQSRYEDLRKAIHDVKSTLTTTSRAEKLAITTRDNALADLEKIRAKNLELASELTTTLNLLRDEKPDIASLWSENAELKKKIQQANTKIEATEKQTAFALEQYQIASAATYEIRKEVEELRINNERLQRLADERVVKVQKEWQMAAMEARDIKIEELTGRLKEREERIQKLEMREGVMQGVKRNVQRRVGSPAQSRGSSPNLAALRRAEV
ncbi:hypothetical protein BDD12DRAFT_880582 [Trichophaea hybrida]|nr:hypothetical protein BDD12DRAFT_880582 [Trichophaea hybrida]